MKTVDELQILNISNYKLYKTYDPLKEGLTYFESQAGITNIKSRGFDASFTFINTSSSEVIKLIKTLNVKTFSQKTYISNKIFK